MVPTAATSSAPLPQRSLLGFAVLVLAGLALCPLVGLAVFALAGDHGLQSLRLGREGPLQVGNTVGLLLLVGLLAAALGTATGCLGRSGWRPAGSRGWPTAAAGRCAASAARGIGSGR